MSGTFFAYKYVCVAAVLSQINHYAPRMHLPIETPVKQEDIRFLHVSAPLLVGNIEDYGGRIQVKNFSFTINPDSLAIYNLDEHGFISLGVSMGKNEPSNSGMERASRTPYVVTTNDVYRIATNFLVALDIDLGKLESSHPPCINRSPLFKSTRGWVPTPLLTVEWLNPNMPGWDPAGVYVVISAVTGELLSLHDGNGSFSRRKRPLLSDLKRLLAIPDEEFLRYSEKERRELVEKFAGVKSAQDVFTNIPPPMRNKLFRPNQNSCYHERYRSCFSGFHRH